MADSDNIKKRKKVSASTIAIIAFFAILAFAALMFAYTAFYMSETASIELPTAKATCLSTSDGTSHNISAKFSLTGNKNTISDIGQPALYKDVVAALSDIDFSKLPEDNQDEFIKKYIQASLNTKYKDIEITEIYLTDFGIDAATKFYNENETTEMDVQRNGRQNILDGMSNWNN